MERAFIIGKDSDYSKKLRDVERFVSGQRKVFIEFAENKGIDGDSFAIGGDGFMNQPFEERNQDEIYLRIKATENNNEKFEKFLCKESDGMRRFRKNSSISKEFAKKCVDERVVINTYGPRISDYFKCLYNGFLGCRSSRFEYQDDLYIKIESDHLSSDEVPEYFKEIPLSIFYSKLEEGRATKDR